VCGYHVVVGGDDLDLGGLCLAIRVIRVARLGSGGMVKIAGLWVDRVATICRSPEKRAGACGTACERERGRERLAAHTRPLGGSRERGRDLFLSDSRKKGCGLQSWAERFVSVRFEGVGVLPQ